MLEKIISLTDVPLINLLGTANSNLQLIIEAFPQTKIIARGDKIILKGSDDQMSLIQAIINLCIEHLGKNQVLTTIHVKSYIDSILNPTGDEVVKPYVEDTDVLLFGNKGMVIKIKSKNQRRLVDASSKDDIVFAIGPAGTGKTYLAVAAAVDMLERNEIQRILLVRPAVEAGEKLGFLPGDLSQKIDPYLRPLYDALYEMLGFEKVAKLIERQIIEVAPLAYMRGRTLNHSFVILDEAQNTTPEQMKMFLTRLGFGSRAVITGDVTQVDLPRGQQSGLAHSLRVLENVKEIHITRFHSRDVVRHQLVQKIVEAYEGWDSEQQRLSAEARAERKARQEALVAENDAAADAQH